MGSLISVREIAELLAERLGAPDVGTFRLELIFRDRRLVDTYTHERLNLKPLDAAGVSAELLERAVDAKT